MRLMMSPATRLLAVALATTGLVAALVACRGDRQDGSERATNAAAGADAPQIADSVAGPAAHFAGSASCRECHERFYQLWAPSRHGLAMRAFSAELARTGMATPGGSPIVIGDQTYRVEFEDGTARVIETGPGGETSYRIEYALGGKNVFYFLTRLERGRLQVLPLGYDARAGEWFDVPASGMRHFPGDEEGAISWRDWPYTFNTACYGCHVSQIETNYDLEADTYETAWKESGINCETCHGPASEHIRVCQEAAGGDPPGDLKIILTKQFDVEQSNDLCAPCHAKSYVLTDRFAPGERYFDQFDLVTLESPDYYPDGRDLGENYTMTGWSMSPCNRSGQLDCMHCHTSSGRFRQKDDPNTSCAPCHDEKVSDPTKHTFHLPGSAGSLCISCHMPKTTFARMERHDHSMRPPAPAATAAFGSPNACNICHPDRDPAWADALVREWRSRDYQKPLLYQAGLIEAARRREWTRLPEMLAWLEQDGRDPVFAASLIRLLRHCDDDAKKAILLRALNDDSPLVRASAAEALGDQLDAATLRPLVKATGDEYRLVRIRAASSLAGVPPRLLDAPSRAAVNRAIGEFAGALRSRPDDGLSHYNLGNLHIGRGAPERAIEAFETAIRLRPAVDRAAREPRPRLQRGGKAREMPRAACTCGASDRPYFSRGKLQPRPVYWESWDGSTKQRQPCAERWNRTPSLAQAAYNLAVMSADDDIGEAIHYGRLAAGLRPEEPRYAYTLAFYLRAGRRHGWRRRRTPQPDSAPSGI